MLPQLHRCFQAQAFLHLRPLRFSSALCLITFIMTARSTPLDALEEDHDYLTAGGVFPEELLKSFIARKRAECSEISKIPHPAEFDRYFNL